MYAQGMPMPMNRVSKIAKIAIAKGKTIKKPIKPHNKFAQQQTFIDPSKHTHAIYPAPMKAPITTPKGKKINIKT